MLIVSVVVAIPIVEPWCARPNIPRNVDELDVLDASVPGITFQSPTNNVFNVSLDWYKVVSGLTINKSGCLVLSTQLSIGGFNDITPSNIGVAYGFTLIVLLANGCVATSIEVYGKVNILVCATVFTLNPNDSAVLVSSLANEFIKYGEDNGKLSTLCEAVNFFSLLLIETLNSVL